MPPPEAPLPGYLAPARDPDFGTPFTRITDPKGGKPIDAVWQVSAGAKPLVSNITVNGVNVALTQEQDFSAYIDKNGFDALVDFMRKSK